jgi:AcrR family transcriptional regulator
MEAIMSKSNTKLKIIQTAKSLFAKNGFEGTSTRDIVSAAGVNISLITYYFGNKENLFFALFEGFPVASSDQTPERSDQLLKELEEIIISIVKLRFDEPDLVTILQQELYRQSTRSEKLVERLIPTWNRIREIIELGSDQGLFQIDDINMALSFVMAAASFPRQHCFYQDYINKTEKFEDVIRETLKFILRGLGCTSL